MHRNTSTRRMVCLLGLWSGLLAAQSSAPQQAAGLVVRGDVSTPLTLSRDDLAQMPRHTVSLSEEDGTKVEYEGVLLRDVLAKAGAPLGKQMRGKALTTYVVAHARDGYRVLFSLAELDEQFGNETIVIADKRNGKALFDYQGPLRLVCAGDKAQARSARMLDSLEVVRLAK